MDARVCTSGIKDKSKDFSGVDLQLLQSFFDLLCLKSGRHPFQGSVVIIKTGLDTITRKLCFLLVPVVSRGATTEIICV